MQCQQCNAELDLNSKFCPHCGAVVSPETIERERKKIADTKPIQKLIAFVNGTISFIVGVCAFTIIKIIISLFFIALVMHNVLKPETYDSISPFLVLLSIYFAVVITKKLNKLKQQKIRIILRILIIVIGFISGVMLGINNSLVRGGGYDNTNISANR